VWQSPIDAMKQIYLETYSSGNRYFEIVGFKDEEKIRIKIFEITLQKRIIIPQFEVTAIIGVIHDANILETDIFQQFVKAAKQFIEVYAAV
jgi:hypothetical protein